MSQLCRTSGARRLLPGAAFARREPLPRKLRGRHFVEPSFPLQARSGGRAGVGIALRQGGLVAPAIHDVDRTSLGELMARLADLVQRARGGGLRRSELSNATLTVTNLGDHGTDSVFGIIYPPRVALVGFGKPKLKPWAEGECSAFASS